MAGAFLDARGALTPGGTGCTDQAGPVTAKDTRQTDTVPPVIRHRCKNQNAAGKHFPATFSLYTLRL